MLCKYKTLSEWHNLGDLREKQNKVMPRVLVVKLLTVVSKRC